MIERQYYLKKLKSYTDKPVIKVITGMRRVGKSTLLQQYYNHLLSIGIHQENILIMNMESLEFDFIRTYSDLNKHIKRRLPGKNKKYLLIDEVQNIREWEKAINSLFSGGHYDITITGSNARMLSTELSTLLSGRYIEIPVYTLSFKEFIQMRLTSVPDELTKESFRLFLRYGGLPGIHHLPLTDEAIFPYLNAIYNTILLKDVVSRNKIREVELLERITHFILNNCGNITSAKNIADYLKSQRTPISVETVQNYLHFLTQAYMIHRVRRYDLKGKRYLEYFEKFYPADVGLRFGITGYNDENISGILENIVYLALIQQGNVVSTGQMGSNEVDFIATFNNRKSYIQVAYLLADEKTVEREFGNLERIHDNWPKMVVSMDDHWGEGRGGILRKSIPDFLLEI